MNSKPSVLLVSIDALKPEFVFDCERLGVQVPFLQEHVSGAAMVAREGVQSVFPPFTYPCHQSIITGANPKTHGIVNNGIFDPTGTHKGAWHWFANKRVKTLWQAAKEAGYVVGSVAFPTSVGAKGDFVAPEFWWDGTAALDSAFIDALSNPQGLIDEMEADIGQYAGGLDLTDTGDAQRFKAAKWILDNKIAPACQEKPFFMTAYFASFDESAHQYGVYSKEAAKSLEAIDGLVRQLVATAQSIAGDNLIVCIVSDHGTLDNTHTIYPNVRLREAGLIQIDPQGHVTDWKAWSQRAGGISEIRLNPTATPADKEALAVVMAEMSKETTPGIYAVLTGEEAKKRGGFPDAAYVLIADKGYEIREEAYGDYIRTTLTQKAQHGYNEEFEEMRASFMIKGQGIKAGIVNGMRLIDIAPTLADIMGASLPDAEGHSVI